MIVTKLTPNQNVKSGIMSTEVKVESGSSDKSANQIVLKGFKHQVGGRASIYYYDRKTLCKPYVSRELYFYSNTPPQLNDFIPKFKGLITVHLFHEDDMQLTAYALPRTLLEPGSSKLKSIVEQPKTHSKRCIKKMDQLQTSICTMEADTEKSVCVGVAAMSIEEICESNAADSQQSTESFDSQSSLNVEERKLWSTKVLMDAWVKSKLGNGENLSGKPIKKQFMLLKNITSKYQSPCVLDLKVGTCIRNNDKLIKLDHFSTRVQLGLRLCGMQMFDREKQSYTYLNKYDGEKLSVDQLRSILQQYFANTKSGVDGTTTQHTNLLDDAIKSLTNLHLAMETIKNRRFYSCSILLVYEGFIGVRSSRRCKIEVKIIDFAHYCLDDAQLHPGVDTGLMFGISNLLSLLESFPK